MGNADYIWEQIGVWFAAYQRIIILLGCLIIVTSLVVWKRKKLVDVQKELTEKWMKFTNTGKVFWAGIASLVIFFFLFIFFQICFPELMERSAGLWNFIILVVSAPVAFQI